MSDPRLFTFIQHTVDGNAVDARKEIDDVMLDKIKGIIDDRKVEITQNLVGGTPEYDEPETEADEQEYEDQEETDVIEPQEDSNGEEAEGNTEEGGTDN